MNMSKLSITLVVWGLACGALCHGAGATPREVAIQIRVEDLSGCRLRHGITELPSRRSTKARELNGYIFSFKENSLAFDPFELEDREADSFNEFRDGIIERKTGDIFFAIEDRKLFFCAFSGRIKELGEHFLHEFDGVELVEAEKMSSEEEGEQIAGLLPNICLGNCYLMTTLEGNLVLVRVISVAADRWSCAIQWVEALPGAKTFEIAKGVILEPNGKPKVITDRVEESGCAPAGADVPQIAVERIRAWERIEQLEKATGQHLENRQRVLEGLMKILKVPEDRQAGRGEEGVLNAQKGIAIRVLGRMRSGEAASVLASIIDTPVSAEVAVISGDTVDSSYGCVAALVRIGKPGAMACLDAIVKLTAEQKKLAFREKLLVLVIVRVEGEKFARLLLEDKKASIAENKEQVENLERAIALIDEVKSWR